MDVRYNDAAIAGLVDEATPVVQAAGEQVADRAQANARRLFREGPGGGIASLAARMARAAGGPASRIGWDADHYYMAFHEFGTSHEPARPYLRPALYAARRGGE